MYYYKTVDAAFSPFLFMTKINVTYHTRVHFKFAIYIAHPTVLIMGLKACLWFGPCRIAIGRCLKSGLRN